MTDQHKKHDKMTILLGVLIACFGVGLFFMASNPTDHKKPDQSAAGKKSSGDEEAQRMILKEETAVITSYDFTARAPGQDEVYKLHGHMTNKANEKLSPVTIDLIGGQGFNSCRHVADPNDQYFDFAEPTKVYFQLPYDKNLKAYRACWDLKDPLEGLYFFETEEVHEIRLEQEKAAK